MGVIWDHSARTRSAPAIVQVWLRRVMLWHLAGRASSHPPNPSPFTSRHWKAPARCCADNRSRRIDGMKISDCDADWICGSMADTIQVHAAFVWRLRVQRPRLLFSASRISHRFLPRRHTSALAVGTRFAEVDTTRNRASTTCARRREVRRDVHLRLAGELPYQRRFVRNHRGNSASAEFRPHLVCAGTSVHRTVRAPWYAAHWSGY